MNRNKYIKLDYNSLGFIYMYNKVFNNQEIHIEKILRAEDVQSQMNLCQDHLNELIKSKGCKHVLIEVQKVLLNIYKIFYLNSLLDY